MCRVDRSQNRLSRLVQKGFSDLNLRERVHLQEWLANQPDAPEKQHLKIPVLLNGFAALRVRIKVVA